MVLSSDQQIDLIAEDAARNSSTTANRRLGNSNDVEAVASTFLRRRFLDGSAVGERRVLVTLGVILGHLRHPNNAGVPAPAPTPAPERLEIERPREPMELGDDVSHKAQNSTVLQQDSLTMDWKNESEGSVEPMETSGRSSSQEAMELGSSNSSEKAVGKEEEAGPSQHASPEAMETSGSSEASISRIDEPSTDSVQMESVQEDRKRAGKRKMLQNDGPDAKRHKDDDSDSGESDGSASEVPQSSPAAEQPEVPQPAPSTSTSPPSSPIAPDAPIAEADIAFHEESEDSNSGYSPGTSTQRSNGYQPDSPISSISTLDDTAAEADVGFIEDQDGEENGSENSPTHPPAAFNPPEVDEDIGNETAGILVFQGPPAKIGKFDGSEDSSVSGDESDQDEEPADQQNLNDDIPDAPTSLAVAHPDLVAPIPTDLTQVAGLDDAEDAEETAGADLFQGPPLKRGRFDEPEDLTTPVDEDEQNVQNPTSPVSSPDGHVLAGNTIVDDEDDTPGVHAFDSPPRKMGRFDSDGDEDEQNTQTPNPPVSSHYGNLVPSDDNDDTPGVHAFDGPIPKAGRYDDSSSSRINLDDTVGDVSGNSSPVFDADVSLVADTDSDADSVGNGSNDDQGIAAPDLDFEAPAALDDAPIDEPEDDGISYSPSSPDSNSYLVRSLNSSPSSLHSNASIFNSPDAASPPRSPLPAHPDDDDDDEDPEDEEDPDDDDSDDDDDIPIDLHPKHFSADLLNVLPNLVDQNEIDSCDAGRWIGAEALFFALLREATTFNLANVDTDRRCAVMHSAAFEEAKRLVGEDAAEKERMKRLGIRGQAAITQIHPDVITRWVVYGNQWSEMLIPINIGGTHWAIVVVKRQSVQAVILDSNPHLQAADQKPVKEMVKSAVRKLLEGLGSLNRDDSTTSRYKIRYTRSDCRDVQPPLNGDCGIYAISHARKVLERKTFNGKTKAGEQAIDIGQERRCLKRMLVSIRNEYNGQVLVHQPGRGQLPCCPRKLPVTLSYTAKRR